MQVEGLCSMVSGVEELVAKAERHCTAMQVYLLSSTVVANHALHTVTAQNHILGSFCLAWEQAKHCLLRPLYTLPSCTTLQLQL